MREGLPQVLSPDVLVLALKFMGLIRRRDVRLGFNSLGGCVGSCADGAVRSR